MMYAPKFLSLDDAARLIADRLKAEDLQAFVDDQATIESARRQLLAALYEGAVRAEGVWWEVPGENEEPEVQYDAWNLIPQGLWSHARYDEDSDGEAVRLDTIGLGWTTSSFSMYDSKNSLTETEVHKIRVCRADIDQEFLELAKSVKKASSSVNLSKPLPGRPRSFPRHLVLAEMRRRAEAGILSGKIGADMQDLVEWVRKEHPHLTDRVTEKNFENIFRPEYRKLTGSRKSGQRPTTASPK